MFRKTRHTVGKSVIDARRNSSSHTRQSVILVHGIGVSGNYFMPLAELFASQYDVHVLDMPGYGKTPKPPKPLSPSEQADVVAGYIEELGITGAVIMGQSMGCQTVSHVAARYPAYCKKLILIGPTLNKWERSLPMQAFRLLFDTFVEPPKVNLIILHDYVHMGVAAYLRTTRYMLDDHTEDTLREVSTPTCIIRGGRDWIAPVKWVDYLGSLTRGGEVHSIKDGPHNVQYTHAKEVYAICERFLEK